MPEPVGAPETSAVPGDRAVWISGLQVRFGAIRAVNGLDLDVPTGQITVLLGPNGAGKSTTVAVIAGLIRPTEGRITVLGGAPGRIQARSALGVMLQEGGIPTGAHAVSIVRHHAALRGAPATADPVIEELGLAAFGRTTFRRMSGGQRRLVALGCALVGHPRMVIVDEPTAGLDPQARRSTWNILDRLRSQEVTVLLSTHDLDEAERLGDHIAIMSSGRLVIQGPRAQLVGTHGNRDDVIIFEGPLHLDLTSLRDALPADVELAEILPGRYRAVGSLQAREVTIITAWANQHGVPAHKIRTDGTTLEDLYFAATGGVDQR